MKRIITAACLLLAGHACFAQAIDGSVKVSRDLLPAAVIQLPYAPDIVSEALADYLSKKGRSKGTDIKGFTTFRNTQTPTDNNGNADLYFKVERKSRQEKGSTLVSLLLTAPKAGDVAGSNLHYLNMEEAKAYLNGLVPVIEAHNLEQSIKDQNTVIIKTEARYKSLTEDGTDLDKKKLAIEKKINENRMAVQSQESEIALQKQKLETLVSKRKN
jgi:hypothetical protein